MTLQARDKKIIAVMVPVVVLLGFWFLILAPKRAESGKLGTQLTQANAKRDAAVSAAGALEGARNSYAKDYETVVRLGKAVPASLDMPSLLVQLESAAKGTNIEFDSVKAGARTAAAPTTAAPAAGAQGGSSSSASSSSSSAPPAAAGGAPAQTGPGKATEKAGDAKNTANQSSSASATAAGQPAAGAAGAAGAAAPAGGAAAPGLDSVPLEFAFTGGFFDLADFFHRMKRFVHLANERIKVQGRLITIDSLDFKSETFPQLSATVKATVYLSPKEQGTTAGGTPAGPGPQTTQPAAAPASTPTSAGAP